MILGSSGILLRDSSPLHILRDPGKDSQLGLHLRVVLCQFLLNFHRAKLPTGVARSVGTGPFAVQSVDAALQHEVFPADDAAADVVSAIQGQHIVCLHQRL